MTGKAGEPGSGAPDMQGPGGAGRSAGDAEDVFNESLGDFDGQMQRERAGMASTGEGSGRAAGSREASDASQVRGAASGGLGGGTTAGGGMSGGMQGMGGIGGSASIPGAGGSQDPQASQGSGGGSDDQTADAAGARAGAGQTEVQSGAEGSEIESSERDSAMVGEIPQDIPADGSGEDQVAQQIREAAMAESDPQIREALWDEYRRHMGLKKKK